MNFGNTDIQAEIDAEQEELIAEESRKFEIEFKKFENSNPFNFDNPYQRGRFFAYEDFVAYVRNEDMYGMYFDKSSSHLTVKAIEFAKSTTSETPAF